MKFEIKKGKHRSGLHFKPVLFGGKTVKVSFKIECYYYDNSNIQLREQINKIYGYSNGFRHHHYNSERVGFRLLGGSKIEVLKYYYENGHRHYISLGEFNLFEWIHVEIKKPLFGYTLFPYFGGQLPAPVDLKFKIIID